MGYCSILHPGDAEATSCATSGTLHDAGLDEIFDAACADGRWSRARTLFQTLPQGRACALWRQSVFADLAADAELRSALEGFSERASALLDDLSEVLVRFTPEAERPLDHEARLRLLGCAARWCRETDALADALSGRVLGEALGTFARSVAAYVSSDAYLRLRDDVAHTAKILGYVEYALLVDEGGMRIRKYQGEADLAASLQALVGPFADFAPARTSEPLPFGHPGRECEAQILASAARDFGDQFRALETFCSRHAGFADEGIARAAWDFRFYAAWAAFTDRMGRQGYAFVLPELAEAPATLDAEGLFDATLALAGKEAVPADIALEGAERLIVVAGDAGSGRTCLAHAAVQLFWLAALGLSVPAAAARVGYVDEIASWTAEAPDARRQLAGIRGALAGAGKAGLAVFDCPMPEGTPEDEDAFRELLASTLAAREGAGLLCVGPDGMELPERIAARAACYAYRPGARHLLARGEAHGMEHARSLAERFGLGREELLRGSAETKGGEAAC